MAKKELPLTNFPCALQVKSHNGNFTTGFLYLDRTAGYTHHDDDVPHNYILFLLSGTMNVSCNLFTEQTVRCGHTLLIPQGGTFDLEAASDFRLLIFVFDTHLMKTESRMLKHICNRAYNSVYRILFLPLPDVMVEQLLLIVNYMKDRKISNTSFYENLNSLIFILFESYYDWNTVADFFHVILSSKIDFRNFILNNYLEAERNVDRLIELSKLGQSTFHKRFKKEFGTTAKQWMMLQEAEILFAEAGVKGTTPAVLIEKLKLNNITQLRLLCRKHFGCSPGELIEMRQVTGNNPPNSITRLTEEGKLIRC